MEHDYAARIAEIDKEIERKKSLGDEIPAEVYTVRHALRFAEKMMADPTFPMYHAGFEEIALGQSATEVFKAMRDQALKELGE